MDSALSQSQSESLHSIPLLLECLRRNECDDDGTVEANDVSLERAKPFTYLREMFANKAIINDDTLIAADTDGL